MVGLQAFQGFVDLRGREVFSTAIDLSHQKNLLTITVAQSLAHFGFTLAVSVVVVPGVVHEVDAAIYRGANDSGGKVV